LEKQVASMETGEMHIKFWSENMKGKYHVEDLGIDWRIILE